MRLAAMFREMATSGKPLESRPQVNQQVSLKHCECAGMQTPHIHKPDYIECAWCQRKVYPNERTQSSS